MIRYVSRKELDTAKWDRCIDTATNGLIYAYSFYLDKMSMHWDGLVMNDYEYVMPLTWKKKYGIHYLYQPAFTAMLGIFGNSVTENIQKDFLEAIPSKFKLIEIDLNQGNNFLNGTEELITRTNFVLDLNKSYSTIFNNYRENTQRNIKKAVQLNCRYEEGIDINEVIELSKQQMQKISNLSDSDYDNFLELFNFLHSKKQALTTGVYSANNELIASTVYFFSHSRAYYILVGNHPNGKTLGASHYLIDRFIYNHCERNLLLDFEGSDIRNLAFFYSSFGAKAETYSAIRKNNLPWWVNIFKK